MTGESLALPAATAIPRASRPLSPTDLTCSRILMPTATSGFSRTVRAALSGSAKPRFSSSPGTLRTPCCATATKASMRVRARSYTRCRNPVKFTGPAEPASAVW